MQRPSREKGQSRQERAALLQAIALKRSDRLVCSDSEDSQEENPKHMSMVHELEDSSDEDAAGNTSRRHTDQEKHNLSAKPALRRLRKLVSDNEVDSIANSLGALDVKSEGQTVNVSSQISAEENGGLEVSVSLRQLSSSQEASSDDAEAEFEAQFEEGLCLGDNNEFKLDPAVSRTLYAHQVEGVKWLWSLHCLGRGGILGDDMGLGKTMQCAAFMSGMIKSGQARRALVVAPKTLLAHWEKELRVCGLASLTHEFYGTSQCAREESLMAVKRRRGVLLTTYGMILHNAAALSQGLSKADDNEEPLWDILILDEGHKIKNPRTQLAQRLREIPVRLPVIISGTPIQNDLMEMHALIDFTCPGLLGEARFFKQEFVRPITAGTDKGATERAQSLGAAKAAELRARIGPYFLRREKKHVFKTASRSAPSGEEETGSQSVEGPASIGAAKPQAMGRKNDLVVWLKLQPMQRRIYEAFLNSSAIKAALNKTGSALAALTVLKKVCDHPALLSDNAAHLVATGGKKLAAGKRQIVGRVPKKGRRESLGGFIVDDDEEESTDEESSGDEESGSDDETASEHSSSLSEEEDKTAGAAGDDSWGNFAEDGCVEQKLLEELTTKGASASCKTRFVLALVDELVGSGHRVLVFSQSRLMLDILAGSLKHAYLRIDGSVSSAAERQARVARFQRGGKAPPVFLLTSQVGGLGLTLTAADRVIIVDPSWNPSMDNQAVDRAFRIGQSRDVVVYRLITCGTVEEKIYRKQVYKGGLFRTGTEEGIQTAYFSSQDLRDLFRLEPAELEESVTQRQLDEQHGHQRSYSAALTQHLQFLQGIRSFAGVSDHDLLFSEKGAEPISQPGSGATFPDLPPPGQRTAQKPPAVGRKPSASAAPKPGRGWQGSGDISDMFKRSLSLGLPDEAAARTSADMRRAKIAELTSSIQRQEGTLKTLNLPDGGAQLRERISQQRRLLAELTAQGEGAGSQTTESGAAQAMRGAGPTPFTGGTASHLGSDPALPKIIGRSFLGSGISAPERRQLEAAPSGFTTSVRPTVHQNKPMATVVDSYGQSAVSGAKSAQTIIAAFPWLGRVSDSAPRPNMPAVETQKSSADRSKAAGRAARPGAAGFLAASWQLPAQGDDASDGQIRQSTGGHNANGSLIRRRPNPEDSANGGEVRRAATAQPADTSDSFKSSHSAPDQDAELIDLTSPPASLPQQKDTSFPNRSDKGATKFEDQGPPHHELAASSRFAAQGMSSAGGDGSADGHGKATGRSGESHRSSGKENAAEHSNSRRMPAPRSDVTLKAATSSKSSEIQHEEAARLTEESARMKQKLKRYVNALNDPAALAQMTDGGAQLRAKAKAVSKERERIKSRLAELDAFALKLGRENA
ncbi:probable DNA excision repair protein ERCC-6-like [Coccomyxa sp. Obi]|nr:probable DNA excision repair protein ERCC-6-like [Coccomyxa sp. Obi]